ncbi:ATP-grasp fold amidoligase family protein [Pseudoclavibacter sp. Z016]|uniref:ATP-grasp fold amidoligase family protein n=1 Tax=Pseudoclavibacter sp. Z016 TaxID=2080581 RepID=UPI002157105C|nr:ATP-grasp fold amidoligase family protein [Pseudoclavibacter sp. Z016]
MKYKMLRDRRPLLVTFADKAAVRDHVAERVGAHYLPAAYAIVDDPSDLADLDLPDAYVVKPTHGSGAVVVVSPAAPADARLPRPEWGWVYSHVRPETVDREQLVRIGEQWVAKLYGQGPNREWVYGHVPRRVIIEECLIGPDGEVPEDFKFFVFHGQVRYVQVDGGRFGKRTQDFFTPDWQRISMSGGLPWQTPTPAAPARLAEMLDVAAALGADTDFVRVDLYHLPDRVVFGELTNYPAGGHSPFEPESWNATFGAWWHPPKRYAQE